MAFRLPLKHLLPRSVRNVLHFFYAWWGGVIYRHPSEKLFVIGVTGTSGKSSTIYFLRQILESAGFRVGALSTLEFCVAGECQLNDRKMTMLGKMEIQRYLREMVKSGCAVAIIETTSEGYLQHRHRFINYDLMVLTNLYPEHIEAHGSFEKYKQAKLDIFKHAAESKRKIRKGKIRTGNGKWEMGKVALVNGNNEYAKEFLRYDFDRRFVFGISEQSLSPFSFPISGAFLADAIQVDKSGLQFSVAEQSFHPVLSGRHNVCNLTAVIAIARVLELEWSVIERAINHLRPAPGRIEFIPEAEKYGFKVIVDYAFEPVAMAELYKVVKLFAPSRIIHVFGSTGGGRDVARRFTVGKFVGERADICIVTNEDPYDDDPIEIIKDVAGAVRQAGKRAAETLFLIPDRGEAIKKALALGKAGDVILLTGKGSEQAMVVKGRLIPWDDREAARRALVERKNRE